MARKTAKKKSASPAKAKAARPDFARKLSDADARIRQADRLARPLRVLRLLGESGRWTRQRMAVELECSIKTVDRTLRVLELAGIPVVNDRESGTYRLQENCLVPPVCLSAGECLDEARELAISQTQSGTKSKRRGVRVSPTRMVVPRGIREIVDSASALTSVLELKTVDHSASVETLRTIQTALAAGRQLQTEYFSPYNDKADKILIHPWRLCFIRSVWYLIGRPDFAREPRNYRVVRFRSVSATELTSSIPEEFDLEQHLGQAWGVLRGDDRHQVAIRFWGPAVRVVTETRWHRTQAVELQDDGSTVLRFEIDGLDEILWWLMSWAPFCRVEQPEELRQRLLAELQSGISANA